MKPSFADYFWAAFNARPIGMFIPPNWIGVAAFALLGALNPGFWLLGAGLELGYLVTLITNQRFRRFVEAEKLLDSRQELLEKQDALVRRLNHADRDRYRALERRCQTILEQQKWQGRNVHLAAQGEGLGRLLWIYLRLLLTRQSLEQVLEESREAQVGGETLEARIEQVKHRLAGEELSDNLVKSLNGQLEILQQRLEKQQQARDKLGFLTSELQRIQDQVELIREQAVVTADPETVSNRIDQIAASLGGTTQWIAEQQQMYGQVEDLLVEPPPVMIPAEQAEMVRE